MPKILTPCITIALTFVHIIIPARGYTAYRPTFVVPLLNLTAPQNITVEFPNIWQLFPEIAADSYVYTKSTRPANFSAIDTNTTRRTRVWDITIRNSEEWDYIKDEILPYYAPTNKFAEYIRSKLTPTMPSNIMDLADSEIVDQIMSRFEYHMQHTQPTQVNLREFFKDLTDPAHEATMSMINYLLSKTRSTTRKPNATVRSRRRKRDLYHSADYDPFTSTSTPTYDSLQEFLNNEDVPSIASEQTHNHTSSTTRKIQRRYTGNTIFPTFNTDDMYNWDLSRITPSRAKQPRDITHPDFLNFIRQFNSSFRQQFIETYLQLSSGETIDQNRTLDLGVTLFNGTKVNLTDDPALIDVYKQFTDLEIERAKLQFKRIAMMANPD